MEQSTVARAFELARSGTCSNVDAITRQLAKEGYSGCYAHLEGPSIRKQLSTAIRASAG